MFIFWQGQQWGFNYMVFLNRVKRKQSVSDDIFTLRNGNKTLELERIPDNTPIKAGMKLLANEEFEKETGGYQSETEEDIPDQLEETLHADGTPDKKKVSKKRKASKMRQSSKYVNILFMIYLIKSCSCSLPGISVLVLESKMVFMSDSDVTNENCCIH